MASTILIVEDEVELAQVLRDYLEKAGFRVQLATTGAAAVSTFRHSPADLVVLDGDPVACTPKDLLRMKVTATFVNGRPATGAKGR